MCFAKGRRPEFSHNTYIMHGIMTILQTALLVPGGSTSQQEKRGDNAYNMQTENDDLAVIS
jgi:hypothetical protein